MTATATAAELDAGASRAGMASPPRWWRHAVEPVPAASLAVFRMAFGGLAVIGALRFLAKGWVSSLYVEPAHHLTYPGFDWVHPFPGLLAYAHVVLLAVLGGAIAVGYRHRLAAAVYVVAFTYAELIDAALYLNHYWFITLAGVLLAVVPASRQWSVDARRLERPMAGRYHRGWVPRWAVWAVRAQLGAVYVFAGLAKLNHDWLVEGLPLRLWLPGESHLAIVGPWLEQAWVAHVASWAGAVFDLTIVVWLSWRRTRPFAYVAVIVFHLSTAALFPIGMFPWIMIASTPIFFSYAWPERLLAAVGRPAGSPRVRPPAPAVAPRRPGRLAVAVALAVAAIEVALPLRHLLLPGDVRWNEEGYYFSWRVMLTEKVGVVEFRVSDPRTGERWDVELDDVLTDWQAQQAAVRPDLLHTAAHLVAGEWAARGHPDVEVRADAWVSFNGRAPQRLVDPSVDLAALGRGWGHRSWVLPLDPAVRA